MGERGRPQSISACQGSLVEGWRKWASKEGGGGYSFTAKQEVAQHLFLCVQRGSEWPAVSYCVSLCRKCCVQPDNMTFPFSQFLHISVQWSFITQSPFPLMWYKWVLKVKYHSNISKLFQNVWQVALSKALKLKSNFFRSKRSKTNCDSFSPQSQINRLAALAFSNFDTFLSDQIRKTKFNLYLCVPFQVTVTMLVKGPAEKAMTAMNFKSRD